MLHIFRSHRWSPPTEIPVQKQYVNGYLEWIDSDNQWTYEAQGNKDFGPQDVTYRFNSKGYRSPEFDLPGDKLLSIGCSTVFGSGLPVEKRFSSIVAEKLGVIECNLAWPGTSNDHMTRLLELALREIKPKFVLISFTYEHRREYFMPDGRVVHYHPMFLKTRMRPEIRECSLKIQSLTNLQDDLNNVYRNYRYAEALLQDYKWVFVSVIDLFDQYMPQVYDRKHFAGIQNAEGPLARDGMHPGIQANQNTALQIVQKFDQIN